MLGYRYPYLTPLQEQKKGDKVCQTESKDGGGRGGRGQASNYPEREDTVHNGMAMLVTYKATVLMCKTYSPLVRFVG